MFESSQDFLYIVLSLSILWFTVFLCWLLYQAARVLKNANRIIESITEKVELMTDAINMIKDRVDGLSKNMGVVSGTLTKLVEKFVIGKITEKFSKVVKSKKGRAKKKK
ncbi:MAG: hypothetical protein L3J07_02800 [Candidatus Magasanikbacteria bacterium]|nr:hypothetical protein [Candidatus Magasanikbacteria bacterium]